MTNRDLAMLLAKLLGLWFSVSFPIGLAGLAQAWAWTERTMEPGIPTFAILALILPSLVYLGVGVSLWFSGESVARTIFPEERPLGSTTLTHEGVIAVGLGLMGIYLLASGIPDLVNAGALVALSYRTQQTVLGPEALSAEQRALWFDATAKARVAEAAAQILLGVVLIQGPKRLKAAILRAKREVLGGPLEDEPGPEGSDGRAPE